MLRAFIGLGSNIANASGNSRQILRDAVQALQAFALGKIQISSLYASQPMGPQDQPDFINAAVLFCTDLTPHILLDHLQQLEQQAGRVRVRRWGERTLDLDILLMDTGTKNSVESNKNHDAMQIKIQDERLTLPHIGILERSFVVQPLLELDADLTINGMMLGRSSLAKTRDGICIIAGTDWAL